MITQTATGLNSRTEANPFDKNGFLPLITAPMYSVVGETNYQVFLDNKIQVCLPRNTQVEDIGDFDRVFFAVSLEEFIVSYIGAADHKSFNINNEPNKICIDTANGNIPQLHEAIKKAKEIHRDNLTIMAGNVASVEAFIELAKTGVDYIRVGIGGGGGCNTTSNTGIGQEDLAELIKECYKYREVTKTNFDYLKKETSTFFSKNNISEHEYLNQIKVKIVADGISSYVKQCESKYGFNDNGYAAINKLLFAGADLVMIGKLFAQCLESAGKKGFYQKDKNGSIIPGSKPILHTNNKEILTQSLSKNNLFVNYSGMSTHAEQERYKSKLYWKWWWGDFILETVKGEVIFYDFDEMKRHSSKHSFENSKSQQNYYSAYTENKNTKPSEGSVNWIPVRWTLDEWLNGSENQDEYPYLMGWVNSIKSAMTYTNKTELGT